MNLAQWAIQHLRISPKKPFAVMPQLSFKESGELEVVLVLETHRFDGLVDTGDIKFRKFKAKLYAHNFTEER